MIVTIAFTAGGVAGYCLAVIHSRQLFALGYHLPYRFWRSYLELYDAFENRDSYGLLGGDGRFTDYETYLKRHKDLRESSVTRFKALWYTHAAQSGRDYILVLIVALGLFWSVFWVFAVPFLAIHAVILTKVRYGEKRQLDFFATLFVGKLLDEDAVVNKTHIFMKRSE